MSKLIPIKIRNFASLSLVCLLKMIREGVRKGKDMLKREGYGILLSLLLLVLMVMTKEAILLLKIKSEKYIKSWAIFIL